MCSRINIFSFKAKTRTRWQKLKETNEEKRISAENLKGYNNNVCACVVYVQQEKYSICYATATYEVRTFFQEQK